MTGWAVFVLTLTACAAPVTPTSPTPAPSLGVAASPLPADEQPTGRPSSTSSGTASPNPGSSADEAGTDGSGVGSAEPAATAPADPGGQRSPTAGTGQRTSRPEAAPTTSRDWRAIGGVADRDGDHGVQGPDHADLVEVAFADDGQRLRVRVDLAADVPARLEDGEVVGLGVDLLRDSDGESRYQLFADGGSDGWRAWLQTPDGFVPYPGTFAIGGRRVEFTVPWSAIGDPASGPARVFLDWSGPGLAGVTRAASEDRAPDDGDLTFTR